ncbi:MAG TPA: sugar phosphate isomerase/epimerase family protein [Streptosporangiaceae bacterium]|nr:sugar phosphate isomerase/epimerase family protein [Streptosporangiaceae bacterium]
MSVPDAGLIGLYWTLSGPVEVHFGREWSLFDFPERCAEAARVGFRGIGIWHADLEHQLEKRSLREMRQILDDNGLGPIELELLQDWFLDADDERRKGADRIRRMVFEAAEVLPVHHIKVGNIPGTPCPIPRLAEGFAELCADAAGHTDAKVVYELMPFDPNVNSLATVLDVVQRAGAPNGGVAIDTWHMGKLRIEPEELRTIPLEYLGWIELSDGRVENLPDHVDETINHRELPGEGEFGVHRYVEVCTDMGYAEPWGVEVLSEELRNLPMEQIFERAYETTAAQFSGV